MDKALEKFGNDIAIASSGAEDVALIEYTKLTGRPFRVFSLDTGRLNQETYDFFDIVEKRYGIHIEYMFPDAVEVQGKTNLRELDMKFLLFKSTRCLKSYGVPVKTLHSQGYVSIGCKPCTRPILLGQHEKERRWWWEDANAKVCGLHLGNIKQEYVEQVNGAALTNGNVVVVDIFDTKSIVTLNRKGIENLAKMGSRTDRVLANHVGPKVSIACFLTPRFHMATKPFGPIKELISDESRPVYREISMNEYLAQFFYQGRDGECMSSFKM
ncbi:hypothetical protein IFM89_012712 [Coptis chinensis]|uniref:Phosphoadenosine phosphosulphate reductase domain-containing protein n=1 Tax=Coptis chinensis TaxID=261450 RepID=A0A835LM66_9MAGN|nr:hypothetical protein IFM89_012712 [Coptis chinensis]